MVDQFTDVFLGFERDCKRGLFGRVKHYYGVVEAQNRGSLHLHILIWLEGALSPLEIQKKAAIDADFKHRFFRWLETAFKLDLPPDTTEVEGTRLEQKQCLLGRPPHPDDPDFDNIWPQFLREVLDVSGQVHEHSHTCFKNIPQSLRSLSKEQQDKLCLFNYPAELVSETFMDENGKVHQKRLSKNVVGHNGTVSGSLQCNSDGKFVGSGAFAAALSIYMTNYTAKSALDSAVVMSALAAAQKALQAANTGVPFTVDEEQCRKLLLKTLNQMNGRRELSGQQVAATLLGLPNHITDARFAKVYWSKLLTWLSPEHFPVYVKSSDIINDSHDSPPEGMDESEEDLESERHDAVDLSDSLVLLNAGSTAPALNSLVYDILYRPAELQNVPMWDQIGEYEKVRRKKKKQRIADLEESADDTTEETVSVSTRPELLFHTEHPQHLTHALRKRKIRHIPVLCVTIIALFRPWNCTVDSPLKPHNVGWRDALNDLLLTLPPHHLKVINHMQEQWECKLAADDFSAMRRKRHGEAREANGFLSSDDLGDALVNDIDWQLGQGAIGPDYDDADHEAEDIGTSDVFVETCSASQAASSSATMSLAAAAGFYNVPSRPTDMPLLLPGQALEDDGLRKQSQQLQLVILKMKKQLF
ncbi:hypothetical protein GGX14DRAFT_594600 [Mycena pura]|uniref:Helitron helicase-like domain-containing protein n=1 Tax=Mycena pura TaxID=153505 RepID=A0AAD6UTK8_9AGAR|nr:hypothetical protein GGX14DRAFT_594600 [Mycena pura]